MVGSLLIGCSPLAVLSTQQPQAPVKTESNGAGPAAPSPLTSATPSTPSASSAAMSPATPSLPPSPQPAEAASPPVLADRKVTLMAVGDIMVHQEQLEAAWDVRKKAYDFAPFFAKVAPLLKSADLAIGNLETTLAGSDLRFTGYPEFNSPESLAAALKQAGFTAVTTANNHSLDRRETGVLRTIAHLDQAGLAHTGTFRSAGERERPLILEKNGIKLGVLAYTYGTNGIPIPQGKPYLVNLIQPALIKQDIAKARALGADLVAVALHFGSEYQRMPNESQKKIADVTIQAGADLILGAHPHVLQPYEWRTVTLPDGSKRTGFVAYSLGNFISAQRRDYKDVGGILKLTLHKRQDGQTVVESPEIIPTYVHYVRKAGKRHYVIYPLPQTLQANQKDPLLNGDTYRYMQRLYKEISVHVASLQSKKKTG
ncbi:CapA family protein [Brevibacillus sp. SYP-B805]|nr:CapA family protein [Brevibacillus sp. SYP-B805]